MKFVYNDGGREVQVFNSDNWLIDRYQDINAAKAKIDWLRSKYNLN